MSGVILTPGQDSPCVARCSTALGDMVCKGCGRTFLEVTHWSIMADTERATVMARLAACWQPAEV